MKKVLLLLLITPMFVFGQTYYRIYADTTIFGSIGSGKNEIVIKNRTKDSTGGFLSNKGNGVTEFKKIRSKKINDSTYVVLSGTTVLGDTIKIRSVGSGGSDSLILYRTYLDLANDISGSDLVKGTIYKITDRGDRGLFFTALTENQLDNAGHRIMLCPAVYGIGNYLGKDWIGVWHITKSANIDDLTIWGGLVWKNLTGNIGTATDDFTLDATNWVLVPKTSFTVEYTELEFEVAYDFANDWIARQSDKYDNIVGYGLDALGYQPVDVTDWNAISSLISGTGGFGMYANYKAVLGIFNNTQQAPSIISGNSSSKIMGNNCGSINANETPIIISNNNTGTISFNNTHIISFLSNTVTYVVNNTTAGDLIDGTVAPFDTWSGDVSNLIVKTTTATDNSVAKVVGVNANGETKLVDKSSITGETIVELGTITYTDINSASATQDITIPLTTNNFPDSSYCVGIIYKFNEFFDGGSDAGSIYDLYSTYIYDLTQAVAQTNYISDPNGILFYNVAREQLKRGSVALDLPIRFDTSNPQDLTAGSVTIYAIVKPFPF